MAERLSGFARTAPPGADTPPHELIRLLRVALRMTQAQLAKRAGLPQSHLARLEAGKVDPQWSTLRKILGALFCDTLIIPRTTKPLETILDERIARKARANVARVSGTMALEDQLPDDTALRGLLRSEEARLRASLSPEIWAD